MKAMILITPPSAQTIKRAKKSILDILNRHKGEPARVKVAALNAFAGVCENGQTLISNNVLTAREISKRRLAKETTSRITVRRRKK